MSVPPEKTDRPVPFWATVVATTVLTLMMVALWRLAAWAFS